MVAGLQRQAETERRSTHRQFELLERRLSERLAAPEAGRERWADLQGSVSGLLEERAVLARRVEGLEEKLMLRTGSCEELLWQRTRELEQQLQAQQQRALLAASASEETSKRHAARLQRLHQSLEESTHRLSALEEGSRRSSGAADQAELASRVSELEGQQASLEDELRSLAAAVARLRAGGAVAAAAPMCSGVLSAKGAPSGQSDGQDVEDAMRALEDVLATHAERTSAQLSDHAAALASLRVRTNGHEQRMAAASERLEVVVAPPIEALRRELVQLRERDRQDLDSRFDQLSGKVQSISNAVERAGLDQQRHLPQDPGASQHEAIQRLEALVLGSLRGGAGAKACTLSEALGRLEGMEQRLACVERDCCQDELGLQADRAELVQLGTAVRELSEPMLRLSQRTARNETRAAELERQLEQLRRLHADRPPACHSPVRN